MPWRECSVMEDRRRFVARLLDGESMSRVCRELQAGGDRGAHGPLAPASQIRQPAARADRAAHRREQAREAALGRQEDQGAARAQAGRRCARTGKEHGPCRARPARPRQARRPEAPLRLGLRLERIKPGHPHQNGRHERMHLTALQGDVLSHGRRISGASTVAPY